jgi:heme/copper-type cytochrome/quinol oxidase subunit 1
VIGIQYLITSFLFLLIGFSMMLLMRWQLAIPPRRTTSIPRSCR